MILKVAKLGVKVLRAVAEPVDPKAVSRGDYEPFLSDLEDTMREYDGTGIAAPQVFTPLRVFLYEVHPETRKRKEPDVPLTALFNASYEGVGEELEKDSEGCLSVPFLLGRIVPRFATIRVRALDRAGKKVDFEASGLPRARAPARDRSPGRPGLPGPDARHEIARLHRQFRLK